MTKLRIGGLDPSLSNFGMCKGTLDLDSGLFDLEEVGLIESKPEKSNKSVRKNSQDLERAEKLYKGTISFFDEVDIICVEVPVGSQTARAMTSYGVCIGILAALSVEGKKLIQVTPTEVKLVATNSKTASKQDMIDWAIFHYPEANWFTKKVKNITSFTAKNEHIADSVAALHAGVKTKEFQLLRSFYLNSKV